MKPAIKIEVEGKSISYPAGITPEEILKDNSVENAADYLAAELNGTLVDLSRAADRFGKIDLYWYTISRWPATSCAILLRTSWLKQLRNSFRMSRSP